MLELSLFYIFATIAVVSAILVIIQRNVVHSAVFLAATLLSVLLLLVATAAGNLSRQGIATGFGFLLREARFELGRALWFAGRKEEAKSAWAQGASAGSFSAWSGRCRQLLELVNAGGEVPRSVSG